MTNESPSSPSLADLACRAQEVRHLYDELNEEHGRPAWDASAFMLGFTADIGSLAKLIMARQGLREAESLDDRLAHELADCLWSILILAAECQIDLEQAFPKTMRDLELRITDERRNTAL